MSDLMTNTRTSAKPEATETQRACDIIRQAHELLGPGMENWVQGHFALDQYGCTVEMASPQATKFCMLGAMAHVAGVNEEDPFYWEGPLRKAYDFLQDTARDLVTGNLDPSYTSTRLVDEETTDYVWSEDDEQYVYREQLHTFEVTETKWLQYAGYGAVYDDHYEPDYNVLNEANDSIPGFNDAEATDPDDVSKVFEHALNACIKAAKEAQ